MKGKIKKTFAIVLSCSIFTAGVGATVFALSGSKDEKKQDEKPSVIVEESDSKDLLKDETVYVLAGSDGVVEKIIVSDWIKNSAERSSITEESALTNVENVKGDETYTINGDNMRVWDSQGNDIYYQGNIEKELPVDLAVTYKLDGKSISPAELAGKSGKVTIRFSYKNNQFETVSIDGENEKIYVPFAMLTGMILDNDIFRNIEVSNGKTINDGDRTIVAGLSFPGLQSNLNIDSEKFEIPDYVEITADANNFKLSNTVTIATNSIFNRFNTENLTSADDLTNAIGKLSDAMDQLMDGSSSLYDGLCVLLDKSEELVVGIDALANGAAQLKSGAGALDSGAADLCGGAKQLAVGLQQISANNNDLNAGAAQIFESLLNMANTQLSEAGLNVPTLTIENYADALNGVIASLDDKKIVSQAQATAKESVTNAVNEQKDAIKSSVTAAVREEVSAKVTSAVRGNVESQVLASMSMTKEQYDSAVEAGVITTERQTQITAAIDSQMQSDTVKALIDANIEEQLSSGEIQTLISSKTEEQAALIIEQKMNSTEVQSQITAALERAKSGAASISALKEQLDSYNSFYTGLNQYTAGVASAKDGADALNDGVVKLKAGTAELYAGINELCDGIFTLKNGAPALIDGITRLKDGSMKLSNGLKEFNESGVEKLTEAVDGDIGGLIARIKATIDVSKNYKSFSGISNDMDGRVKFIYRTEEIKAD